MPPSQYSIEVPKPSDCDAFQGNMQKDHIKRNGSLSSGGEGAESAVPLVDDPERGSKKNPSKLYFGGYTLFEVFCLLLIALSGLSILILLLVWGPINTLQLQYLKKSTAEDLKIPIMITTNGSSGPSNPNPVPPLTPIGGKNNPVNVTFFNYPSEVGISSFKDFSLIKEATTGLKITSLTDSPLDLPTNDKIQRLELLGPVSREGLERLFKSFRSIQYLYVNVEELKTGLSSKKNPSTMNMPMLTSIFMQNSEKIRLFDWPINLKTPQLRKLKVVDAILDFENFAQLQNFMAAAEETLEELEITQCFICPECDLADVQFDNLIKITVNKKRAQDTLDD